MRPSPGHFHTSRARTGAQAPQAAASDPRARLRALVTLLDDDNEGIVRRVQSELLSLGKQARPALRSAESSDLPRLRSRARLVLRRLEKRDALRRLTKYAAGSTIDLERALWLLSRIERDDFDARPYVRTLDAMANEVRERIAEEADPSAHPVLLAQVLGTDLGYSGSEVDFDHPDNIYLHRTIERKRGMPLTLTAIYILVARRVGIRVAAVPLPGHVMLRVYWSRRSVLLDPFRGGRLRTRAECNQYLSQHGLAPNPAWFRDASDVDLLQRHTLNLMNSLQLRGLESQARELHRIAGILGRSPARPLSPRSA